MDDVVLKTLSMPSPQNTLLTFIKKNVIESELVVSSVALLCAIEDLNGVHFFTFNAWKISWKEIDVRNIILFLFMYRKVPSYNEAIYWCTELCSSGCWTQLCFALEPSNCKQHVWSSVILFLWTETCLWTVLNIQELDCMLFLLQYLVWVFF